MSISRSPSQPLLKIESLSVTFPTGQGTVYAVENLDFSLNEGEIVGLVGESGCGKSLTSLAILGLVPWPGQMNGHIWFDNQDLTTLKPEALRRLRGAEVALIPQDPMSSLNPVYSIGEQIREVIETHQKGMSHKDVEARIIELLDLVRIPNAKERMGQYPHQFSGGMRQRVMLAMALSCNPRLLIADEPTTALDVTVQAQVIKLLKEIRRETGTSILFITHDLGVVAELCDRVAVMYAGNIIEEALVGDLFRAPSHPYSQGLLNSLPKSRAQRLQPIEGQPPVMFKKPDYCPFNARCPQRMPVCDTAYPPYYVISQAHTAACYLYADDSVKSVPA